MIGVLMASRLSDQFDNKVTSVREAPGLFRESQ